MTARNRNTLQVFTESEWGSYSLQAVVLSFTPEGHSSGGYFGLSTGAVASDSIRLSFGGEEPGSSDQFHDFFARD